jgi:hypothetical protein
MMFIGIVLKLQPKLVMILRKGLCTRCDGSFGCDLPTKLVKIYMCGDIPYSYGCVERVYYQPRRLGSTQT